LRLLWHYTALKQEDLELIAENAELPLARIVEAHNR
jgi:hypothetical protein